MIYKEANILFPNCAVNFTEDEWNGIYHDMKDYGECFGVKMEPYEKAEDNRGQITSFVSGAEVVLAGGHMTIEFSSRFLILSKKMLLCKIHILHKLHSSKVIT